MNSKSMTIGAALWALAVSSTAAQAQGLTLWGAEKGNWEFTLGGGGTSSPGFSVNAGSFNASIGYYLTHHIELGVRQSFSFAMGDDDSTSSGATRAAADYHFLLGEKSQFRPYLGVSIGGIYGDGVSKSLTAGLEGGVKYYVLAKTFLYGHMEYQWSLDGGGSDHFDQGAWLYMVGVGFNF